MSRSTCRALCLAFLFVLSQAAATTGTTREAQDALPLKVMPRTVHADVDEPTDGLDPQLFPHALEKVEIVEAPPPAPAEPPPAPWREKTIAGQIDKMLEKEFKLEGEALEASIGTVFNETVAKEEAVLETVARVTRSGARIDAKKEEKEKEEKAEKAPDAAAAAAAGDGAAAASGAAGKEKEGAPGLRRPGDTARGAINAAGEAGGGGGDGAGGGGAGAGGGGAGGLAAEAIAEQPQPAPAAEAVEPVASAMAAGVSDLLKIAASASLSIDKVLGPASKEEEEDVERLIDSQDNMFVISNPKSGAMELQQDLQLISDLIAVLVSCAAGGCLLALLGQPMITGFLLAGSAVGPGGFGVVKELVQVETLAQFGVIFLLFTLGVEFSAAKLAKVRGVALGGGLLQILLMCLVCGVLADFTGAPAKEGIFVGALLSMSSTAVVIKCLHERNGTNTLYGQVTVGTLVLQDCTVGLMFALLPVLGGGGTLGQFAGAVVRIALTMAGFLLFCSILAKKLVSSMLVWANHRGEELYQVVVVALCLSVAWASDRLGLSLELGAFIAGVMVSATDLAERTLHAMESLRNLFSALFLASIGMLMNPRFLWQHFDILLASLVTIVLAKATLTFLVVRAFGYSNRTALSVGVAMAQVGEFSFVLLSRASNLGLVQRPAYLLLLGTTALSLFMTPVLFRGLGPLLRAATLMRWVRKEEEDMGGYVDEDTRWDAQSGGGGGRGADHSGAPLLGGGHGGHGHGHGSGPELEGYLEGYLGGVMGGGGAGLGKHSPPLGQSPDRAHLGGVQFPSFLAGNGLTPGLLAGAGAARPGARLSPGPNGPRLSPTVGHFHQSGAAGVSAFSSSGSSALGLSPGSGEVLTGGVRGAPHAAHKREIMAGAAEGGKGDASSVARRSKCWSG